MMPDAKNKSVILPHEDSRGEVAAKHRKPPNARESQEVWVHLAFATFGTALVLMSVAIAMGQGFRGQLLAASSRWSSLSSDPQFVAVAGVGGLVSSLVLAWLLVHKRLAFLCLFFVSLGIAEVNQPALHAISFVVRYSAMLVLIALGCSAVLWKSPTQTRTLRILCVCYLTWLGINVLVHGLVPSSVAMLPAQLAVFVGVMLGFSKIARPDRDPSLIVSAAAICGAVLTVMHLSALAVDSSFLAGRFRSYYPLPTNFANGYVLLLGAMVWRCVDQPRNFVRVGFILLSLCGVVLLFLSGTRNGALQLALVLVVYGLLLRVGTTLSLLFVAGVGFGLGYVMFFDTDVVQELLQRYSNASWSNRTEAWRLSWNYITQSPWIGYGLGRGLDVLGRSVPAWALLDSHNAYFGIWLQFGAFGALSVVAMYGVTFWVGGKLAIMEGRSTARGQSAIPLLALLMALFVGGFFEENLTSRGSLQSFLWAFAITSIHVGSRLQRNVYDSLDARQRNNMSRDLLGKS